ncbi:MAG: transglycosylase SLT domain-containing protein, partial [Candidatus Eremiobacteraeota bacterium]|nr:transglycosylase SLT domain-containing protein [Candidatus Eremiobacteraeota bacterium]
MRTELPSDVAAVVRRIAEIAGEPPVGTAAFDSVMQRASAVLRPSIDRYVADDARAAGVDPGLVEAIIATESAFDPKSTSQSGARGLMQLMPKTAADLGVTDPYDPAQNVRGGTRYLRSLL